MSNYIDEAIYPGEFLLSEGNGDYSREQIVLAKGQNLVSGAILGQVLLGGAAASAVVAGTGNGTVTGPTVTNVAKIGTYVATCTAAAANGGTFAVVDPDGIAIGNATVGIAFLANGLGFTIVDGATDFIVGDTVTITVTPVTVAANAGNTGNGTVGTVTVSTGALAGVYKVVFEEPITNLGTFFVEGPDGIIVGQGNVGTVFNGGGLSFTIADGSADFVARDGFTITLTSGSGEYRAVNPTAKDGSAVAAAILFKAKDATLASKKAVAIVRHAEYNDSKCNWGTLSAPQKAVAKAQLKLKALIARTGIGTGNLDVY